ncbi:hypothetical protein [Arthrobacter russicus]|uniref:ATP synthase protein I n=1 Tax=Arthrobacter russicus TaxID=172040 RepID=A0ABU1J7L3_9MICC|nr:hypothetical protein [Arthrobacter russicus]MDR6268421.1 ATP synthase protein I [Arthrobacter russicus]
MTDSQNSNGSAVPAPLAVSGPTESPWLGILQRCLLFAAPAIVLIVVAAWIFAGGFAALSALFSGGLVLVFFGISLLIGHRMGSKGASAMFGAFAVGYVVKFVGFAGVLIVLGSPDWLDRTWFFISALAAVLIWLTVEMVTFSRLRLQIFNDPAPDGDSRG